MLYFLLALSLGVSFFLSFLCIGFSLEIKTLKKHSKLSPHTPIAEAACLAMAEREALIDDLSRQTLVYAPEYREYVIRRQIN